MNKKNPSQAYSFGQTPRQEVRRSKSHSFMSAGLRRLRTLSQTHNHYQVSTVEKVPQVPAEFSQDVMTASPSAIVTTAAPIPPLPVVCLTQPPNAESLPSQFAQLRGIHFVGDPNQDPNLDCDTTANTDTSWSRRSSSGSSGPTGRDFSLHSSDDTCERRRTQGDCNCISCDSSMPDRSLLTLSSGTQGSSYIDPTSSSPRSSDDQNMLPLSPRACLTAFPPIDLRSPFAPYAPTPPLSPPINQTLSRFSDNSTSKPSNGFNLSKGLRKLPSTMLFKPASKPQSPPTVHQVSYQNPDMGLMITQSANSLKASSGISQEKDATRESQNSSRALSPVINNGASLQSTRSLGPMTFGRSSTVEGLKWPATSLPANKSKTSDSYGSSCSGSISPSRTSPPTPCETPRAGYLRKRTSSSKSNLRESFNTLMIPISHIRTHSSLNTLFRSARSSRGQRRPSDSSSFEAGGDRTESIASESWYEVLDANALAAQQIRP